MMVLLLLMMVLMLMMALMLVRLVGLRSFSTSVRGVGWAPKIHTTGLSAEDPEHGRGLRRPSQRPPHPPP